MGEKFEAFATRTDACFRFKWKDVVTVFVKKIDLSQAVAFPIVEIGFFV